MKNSKLPPKTTEFGSGTSLINGEFNSAEKNEFKSAEKGANLDYSELLLAAEKARENAYAPYSGFKVGAALLTRGGKVYLGCNIENASFGATLCAERSAFAKAISEGERAFSAIAIVGGKEKSCGECFPCGICRQVMSEFCGSEFVIVLGSPNNYKTYTLEKLLPSSFGVSDMR